MTRRHLAIAAVLVWIGAAAFAWATVDEAPPSLTVPDWLYASIAAGIVQGLVTFGAIKVKLDWVFQRLEGLEKDFKDSINSARDDLQDVHKRIDRVIERRRVTDPHD